ncbi:osteopontin-like isoform X3 [Notechis scutatus]|uniref:Osteopontin-like isoform X2 n=1 Tax=Notechis scutatus TaxID=8663 RepID=A0A6J1UKL6_9SAUR|nr:osteopontin-like isoform X2 [Notechis scutatus]XP_026528396.1 osteopontin-like isoform X3 [Notechis scutatus]
MKIAVLILCLFTIAFALPISKSRHHDDSMSAERKHDSRENEAYAHHHHHHNSHSHEHSQEHGNSHEHSQESPEHTSSQLNSQSLEDRDEITEQQTLLASSSKSHEDDDDHSDVSKDDDHPDSDESDESHETTTDIPTSAPITDSNRGDVPFYKFGAEIAQMSLERSGKVNAS